jgi:hypothetical protein
MRLDRIAPRGELYASGPSSTAEGNEISLPATSSIERTRGLAARPESCHRVADVGQICVAETFRNAGSETGVWLTKGGSCGYFEAMVEFAMQLGKFAEEVEGWVAPVVVRSRKIGGLG